MGTETERKFLVNGEGWRVSECTRIREGYLVTDDARSARIRVRDDQATLTIKGAHQGATRAEYEYDIPLDDANEILDSICLRPWIRKHRYVVGHDGLEWEVDEFMDENKGLIIAEVELASEDQELPKPPWLGEEVTDDSRFYNASLVAHPYSEWRHGPAQ